MSLEGIINIMGTSIRFAIPCFILWIIIRGLWLYKKRKIFSNQLKNIGIKREVILNIFIIYIFLLYGITVYRYGIYFNSFSDIKNRLNEVNLNFLEELLKMLRYGNIWHVLYNVVGNIILFIPLGFIFPFIWKKKINKRSILIISMLISISIEIMQFIFMTGISDIDDLFFNVIGGMLGYIFFKVTQNIYKKINGINKKYNDL